MMRSRWSTWSVILGVVWVVSSVQVFAARFTDVWDRFVVLVWQYHVPPPGPAAKAAYDAANIIGIHIDGPNPQQELVEFALQNGYYFYVDHAAGKGDLHAHRNQKELVRRREPFARPNCWHDPSVMRRLKERLRNSIRKAGAGRCVAYAFDDEISAVWFTSPADTCTCGGSLAAFRRYLRRTYGDIASLNAQWGTRFRSFDEVSIIGGESTRLANHPRPLNEWNLSGWCDSRDFIDEDFARCLRELREEAHRLDPRRPAGFVGGQAPSAYGGYDYERICAAVDWMESYDIGGTNEIIRSLAPEMPHVQTWFDNGSPAMNRWFLWYYWAHGNRGVIAWPESHNDPWFTPKGPRSDIASLAKTLEEIQGDSIGKLLVDATFDADPIALYYGQPSVRVSWFIDIIPHGSTWINRSSSLSNGNDTANWNRYAWMKLLEDAGFQYNFVSPGQITRGDLLRKGYRVLILGRALALSDAEAKAIREFAASGGMVIADHLCGVFDEHGKARRRGVLDDLFGIEHHLDRGVLNGKVLYEINGERYQAPLEQKVTTAYEGASWDEDRVVYERGLKVADGKPGAVVDGVPVRITRGSAHYLNLSNLLYCSARHGGDSTWPGLIRSLLGRAGLRPRVAITSGGLRVPLTEALFWKKDGRTILCLIKNGLRSAQIDAAGKTLGVPTQGVLSIQLHFAEPVADLRNERTGRRLGDGVEFADRWVPFEANVYSFRSRVQ